MSSLSEKIYPIMTILATKDAPIDQNDVPLSTSIEKNNDVIDVNFISSNNFNNKCL